MKSENQHNKHSLYWHIGQLYACSDNYIKAIEYIRTSTGLFELLFDREWRYYYKSTIAFLQRDKAKLRKYYLLLWKHHSPYYEKNARVLKRLYDNFQKSYQSIYP